MGWRTKADGAVTAVICAYLRVVAKTARVSVDGAQRLRDGQIIGYWHEDSQGMLVLLRRLEDKPQDISVIVTADRRGNMLEGALKTAGAQALRVHDGLGARHAMGQLHAACEEQDRVVATALDGPTGPRHEPKKLLFHLAGKYSREMLFVQFDYKGVLRLRHRWDRYVVPLPFCRMNVRIGSLGVVTREAAKCPEQVLKVCAAGC